MTPFSKPGTKEGDYPEWAKEAGEKALADAGISYDAVQEAYVGYCYGESTAGSAPSTGWASPASRSSTSTTTARPARARCSWRAAPWQGGLADCALALGFEKMELGSLGVKWTDRTNPMDKHVEAMFAVREPEASPPAPQLFGNAGREHMERYGSTADHYAWIGWKNHKHTFNKPYAQFQTEYSLDEIKAAKMIHEPLTKLQCSPTSDGAACVIVASERFVDEHSLGDRAIEIAGQAMVTDMPSTFEDRSAISVVGYDMSKEAARRAYEEAGVGPRTSTSSSCTTASAPTSSSPTRRSASPRRATGTSSSTAGTRPMAAAGRQPERWADLQGPPARRDRPGAVQRADVAAARRGGRSPGGGREGGAAAQHRPGRRAVVSVYKPAA